MLRIAAGSVCACTFVVLAYVLILARRRLPTPLIQRNSFPLGSVKGLGYMLAWFVVIGMLFGGIETNRIAASEATAVGTLLSMQQCGKQFLAHHPTAQRSDFVRFIQQNCSTVPLVYGEKKGYNFAVFPSQDARSQLTYTISATPIEYGSACSGFRSFLIEQDGTLRYTAANRAATTDDPALQ